MSHSPFNTITETPEQTRDRLLSNPEFMADLKESVREWVRGGKQGTPWEDVKRELGIEGV